MPEPETPSRRWTAGAVALVVLGLLILIPSGLCTATMGVTSIIGMFTQNDGGAGGGFMLLVMTVVLGGPFVGLGIGLIFIGLRERKQK